MPWQDVCLSVSLSVTRRLLCLNSYIYISSNFFHRVAASLVFLRTKRDDNIPTGTPLTHGGIKNDDFRPICRFISELIQDRTIVTMEGE